MLTTPYPIISVVAKIKTKYAPAGAPGEETGAANPGNEVSDIAEQVTINSAIAVVKFRLSTIAVINI